MTADLIIVGGGTAALGAAQAAVAGGARPTIVTDGPIGGDCTFTGCVPSKTLLAEARRGTPFPDALEHVAATIDRIAATESADVLRRHGIDVIEERGRVVAPDVVEVAGRRLPARHIVVATGARPVNPDVPGLSDAPFRTNEDFFEPRPRPERLAIIGAGPIGSEMATAMSGFGTEVVLIDEAGRVLPGEEPQASDVIATSLTQRGVELRLGATVASVGPSGERWALSVGTEEIEVDEILVATGRRPNTEETGLAEIGVELDEAGHPIVDDRMRTSVRSVSAAGDVTGLLPFTHAAYEQGRLAAAHALGTGTRWRYDTKATPWVVFTDPEVARFGLLESQAAAIGGRVAHLPLDRVDRGIVEGETEGFVKLIAAPKRLTRSAFGGRLVGATIVAPRAGEMIHGPALLARTGGFVGRLAQATAAYPTWSIAVQMAAGQFFTEMDGLTARPAQA